MSEERREAQRQGGLQQVGNLLSQEEVLRRREGWKYLALQGYLVGRPHQFEYELESYVFDLALLDANILVEFDGPYHSGSQQCIVDQAKDLVAQRHGFVVVRRAVRPASVIEPSAIDGL